MGGRTYRFEVEGELTDLLRSELGVTTLWHDHGNTVLEAMVRDQSELYGLLQRVSGLGLTLVSLGSVSGVDATSPARRPGSS
jgi:hypothetical protein